MEGCVIFVFSGTGNTAFVAEKLGESLQGQGVSTRVINIDQAGEMPDLSQVKYLGLGYPVYAWSLPSNVLEFARRLPAAGEGQKGFVFATYGGSPLHAVPEGAAILKEKGYRLLRSRGFKFPDNYTTSVISCFDRTTPEERERRFAAAAPAIAEYAGEILADRTEVDAGGGIFGRFVSAFVGNGFRKHGAPGEGKKFSVSDACTSCRLCARTCPVENIRMAEGKPAFQDHCIVCCRCFNVCPVKAIGHPGAPSKEYRYTAPGYKPPILRD
jgi:ferredoxin